MEYFDSQHLPQRSPARAMPAGGAPLAKPEAARRPPLRRRSNQLAGLDAFIKASYPLIYVSTWEEQRFLAGLHERYGLGRLVMQWTYTRGLVNLHDGRCHDPKTIGDPLVALRAAEKMDMAGLFVFCDLHPWLGEDPSPSRSATVRMLRDLYQEIRKRRDTDKTILLVAPLLVLPAELEKEVVVFDFPLPDREEMRTLMDEHIQRATHYGKAVINLKPEEKEKLLEAALGLTLDEADHAFSAALLNDGTLDATDIRVILAEKQLIIRKSGILDYYPAPEDLSDVGGLENLKDWLRKRARSFTSEAREFGIPQPKGVLLTGVQGCGKSLSAKAIATNWQLPLLRLDVGKVFGGLMGSSEENMRKAIKLAEAIAPSVLWVDELEKAFAGMHGSGVSDGGTSARVFGTFLTWMQEKTSNVFVVATANQIEGLPPELLRKGRFDEIFFIDLPNEAERQRIFEIHLSKRRRMPSRFDLSELVRATEGFSGAEIEQAIIEALFEAFDAGQELATLHLLTAIQKTVPLYVTMHESIEALRQWAESRAVPAARPATGSALS
jgi:ATP-dependent 26S proteasome regulatory subunit